MKNFPQFSRIFRQFRSDLIKVLFNSSKSFPRNSSNPLTKNAALTLCFSKRCNKKATPRLCPITILFSSRYFSYGAKAFSQFCRLCCSGVGKCGTHTECPAACSFSLSQGNQLFSG